MKSVAKYGRMFSKRIGDIGTEMNLIGRKLKRVGVKMTSLFEKLQFYKKFGYNSLVTIKNV